MPDWGSYGLSDLQIFSSRTYLRLLEVYNEAIWPAQILAFALGLAVLVLRRRGDENAGRAIAAGIAACWIWVALAFHLTRYASIHWAARYFAAAFLLEAAILLWSAARSRLTFGTPGSFRERAGSAIFLFALFVQPFAGLALGRNWRQLEFFGVAPDPTAVATLGLLLAAARMRWSLAILPLAWCTISGATLLATGTPDAAITPAVGTVALFLAIWRGRTRNRPAGTESRSEP